MSYPMALDECDIELLRREIEIRRGRFELGRCTYCDKQWNTVPVCRFQDRHAGKKQ